MLFSASGPVSLEDKAVKSRGSGDSPLSCPPPANTDPGLSEGGIEAWCTVFGAFLAHFCGFGYTSSFGVYQAFYARHYLQNESPSSISWIGSLATFLVTALGPISGRLFDKGYFYYVYIAGAIIVSLSTFMLSLVQPGKYYQILLVQGLACGIGQGLLFVPSLAILSHHFKRHRAAVMSIVASGISIGSICHTIMLNKLLNGPLGFKTGVRISAAFITALLFLSCTLMRTRYHVVRQHSTPVHFWKSIKRCFTEIPSLLTIIGITLFHITYLYPFFYFQTDSLKHGLKPSFAFYSVVIMDAGSFVGRFASSAFVRVMGVIDLAIISTFACAVLFIGVIWLGSVASVAVLGVLYGFFSGIDIAMTAPMLALMSEPAEMGVRIGVGYAMTSIGSLIGSPIAGALLTRHYHWWAPAVFCGVISLLCGILFIGARISFIRWQLSRADTISRCSNDERKGDHDVEYL